MKWLTRPIVTPGVDPDYAGDVDRLVQIARDYGYHIWPSDALWAWQDFSDTMAAGWMSLGAFSDEEIVEILVQRCQIVEVP